MAAAGNAPKLSRLLILPNPGPTLLRLEITAVKLRELELQAKEIMDTEEDSLIIFESRNERWLDKRIIGCERASVDNFL